MADAEDSRRLRRFGRADLGRAAAAVLAPREVDERDFPARRRLAGEGPAHHELRVVRMGAEPGDVEGVHPRIVPAGRHGPCFHSGREVTMTSGTGDKVKGRVEKAGGELLDDDRLRNRGTVDETAGKIKDSVERGVDAVKDTVTGRPRDKRPPR